MSGAIIQVKAEDGEVKALLGRLSQRASDLFPVMRVIGQIVRTSVIKNFEAEGRPDKWKPLSMATLFAGRKSKFATKKGKFRKGVEGKLRDRQILVDTGRLRNSITAKAFPDRAEIGTNVVYAAIHQFGGKAGRGKKVNIPARPFMMIQDEDWAEIKRAILGYILDVKISRLKT